MRDTRSQHTGIEGWICDRVPDTNIIRLRPWRPETVRHRDPPRIRWELAMAYSVMAVALVLGSAIALRLSSAGTEYACGIGERRIIPLEDGSILTLNTQSRLRVRLSARTRNVELLQGEAFFQVAHDTHRPFRVQAGRTTVDAVGTQFDVQVTKEATEVSVAEGRVNVRQEGTAITLDRDGLVWAEPVMLELDSPTIQLPLSAGQAVRVARSTQRASARSVTSDSLQRHLAWTRGEIALAGETLEQAVGEFNRYSRRQMRIQDPALARLRLGGTFQTADPTSFLSALENVFGIEPLPSDPTAASGVILLARRPR